MSNAIAAPDNTKSKSILTRSEALAIAQSFGFKGVGKKPDQKLYDWSKAALVSESEETRKNNIEKLANFGLVAAFTPENKPAWQAKTHI